MSETEKLAQKVIQVLIDNAFGTWAGNPLEIDTWRVQFVPDEPLFVLLKDGEKKVVKVTAKVVA